MGKPSKEENVLVLFFNYPSKHWYFKEIKKQVPIADAKISRWLKEFIKRNLVKRVKPNGKMPYYVANYDSSEYNNTKKIFSLNQFHHSGLLNHLSSLEKAKAIFIFGSFARGDWYKESDIDLFIYGDPEGLDLGKYHFKLHHEFQLFISKNKSDLKKFGPGLLKSIIKGINIKGDIPIEMIKSAAI